jgi:putative PIN family toxin of toxin-antitoxin system
MRLVLDTNVVISAFLGSGAPAHLIDLAAESEVDLFTSEALVAELAEVLERDYLARRLERRRLSGGQVLSLYEAFAELVAPASIARSAPDPDDDAVLACALAAGADIIVSGDLRLRNLKSFHHIPILGAAETLARVQARS